MTTETGLEWRQAVLQSCSGHITVRICGGTIHHNLISKTMMFVKILSLKNSDVKKTNPNDEINTKVLQALNECENDIATANKALETLDIIWKCEDFEFEINKD